MYTLRYIAQKKKLFKFQLLCRAPIVKHRISLVNEVYYSTDQDDRSRENNAGAKKVAYDGLDPLIAPTI